MPQRPASWRWTSLIVSSSAGKATGSGWPDGFTARVNQVGVLTLLNDGGGVVAVGGHDQTLGDQLVVRGVLGNRNKAQESCMPGEGQVLFVQTASLDNP